MNFIHGTGSVTKKKLITISTLMILKRDFETSTLKEKFESYQKLSAILI